MFSALDGQSARQDESVRLQPPLQPGGAASHLFGHAGRMLAALASSRQAGGGGATADEDSTDSSDGEKETGGGPSRSHAAATTAAAAAGAVEKEAVSTVAAMVAAANFAGESDDACDRLFKRWRLRARDGKMHAQERAPSPLHGDTDTSLPRRTLGDRW